MAEAKTPKERSPRHGKRGPGRFQQDIKQAVEQAFHMVGGRHYLARVAKRRPDVFLALVGKILPAETKLSILAQFQALPLPVPVEEREAIPVRAAPVLDVPASPGSALVLQLMAPPEPEPLGVALGVSPDDDAWEL